MRKLFALAVVVLLFTAPVAAQGEEIFPRDLEDLRVGDETQLVATVSNPLPVNDPITLTFQGDAVDEQTLITIEPAENSDINCPEMYQCNVYVPAEGEMNVNLSVTATQIGQGSLIGVANSSTTGLSSEDQITVRVGTGFVGVDVSAPDITGLHVLLIAALAGTFVFWTNRRRSKDADSSSDKS